MLSVVQVGGDKRNQQRNKNPYQRDEMLHNALPECEAHIPDIHIGHIYDQESEGIVPGKKTLKGSQFEE